MKRKSLNQRIIYTVLCIIFLIVIVISVNAIYSLYKENKTEKDKIAEQERIANSRQVKSYIIEKNDGWYYEIGSERIEVEEGEYTYTGLIGGCNIKYINLDDNYIQFIDETNPKNNYNIPASPPNLSNSYKSKDGVKTENDELKEINKVLKEKDWQQKISDADLSSINFVNFDRKDVVTLWNELYELKYTNDFGSYGELCNCAIKKENKNNNYFQIGIMLDYAKIDKVRIDYYYDDGIYLSDLIEKGKANKEQQALYTDIKNIEKGIINDASFELKDKFNNLKNDSKYSALFTLFQEIESHKDK